MAAQMILAASRRSSLIISGFRQSARAFSTPVETPKPDSSDARNINLAKSHKVDSFERKMFVWTGKYKTVDEVPTYVNQDVMEKTRNKIRIRIANIMVALTVIACLIMVWSGKKAADRGESVQKMNQDWHHEYQEKSIAEAQAKSAK